MKEKKILVAVDFSHNPQPHLYYSMQMALTLNASIVISHILENRDVKTIRHLQSQGIEVNEFDYIEQLIQQRKMVFDDFFSGQTFPQDRVTYHFGLGSPVTELLKLILIEGIELLILGESKSYWQPSSIGTRLFNKSPVTVVCFRRGVECLGSSN